jgi:hypothetical protein
VGPSFPSRSALRGGLEQCAHTWLREAFGPAELDVPRPLAGALEEACRVELGEFGGAPGQDDGETANGLLYTVPLMTYADTDDNLVYETVKAIHENYDSYSDTTATTPDWALESAQTDPRQVPFHPGMVRFLEENDAWTEEAASRNDDLIERGEALRAGWDEFIEGFEGDDIAPEWSEWKEDNVPMT